MRLTASGAMSALRGSATGGVLYPCFPLPGVASIMNPASNALPDLSEQSASPFNLLPFVNPATATPDLPSSQLNKVLIIATNGAVRGGVDQVLEDDFDVHLAAGAEQGLTLVRQQSFALVILDLREIGSTVDALISQLRLIDDDTSVLVLTANRRASVTDHHCVHVPFDAPDMCSQVSRLVKLSARRRGRSDSLRQMQGVISLLQEELQAKESIASYGEASASMVHDLRNALFSTLGYTARLIQETAQLKTDLPDKMGPVDQIARKLEHTSNYLFHLSQTCRYNGGGKARRERFNLTEEVHHVHRVLFFSSPNLTITGDPQDIIGDRFELHRVLQNLFKNAFEAEASEVRAMVTMEEGLVKLRVVDNGRGFEAEDIAVVFQRPLASSKRGGQGLGLRICSQIVERMGGTIALESLPAEGSEFTISLPMAAAK